MSLRRRPQKFSQTAETASIAASAVLTAANVAPTDKETVKSAGPIVPSAALTNALKDGPIVRKTVQSVESTEAKTSAYLQRTVGLIAVNAHARMRCVTIAQTAQIE